MSMRLPSYSKPDRKRHITASFTDPDFVRYYDLDLADFTDLVMKIKNDEPLDHMEDIRYGDYILTMCHIILQNPKLVKKTKDEKEEMVDRIYEEMLEHIVQFTPGRASVYSFAYRVGYVGACKYFKYKKRQIKHEESIRQHLEDCFDDYVAEVSDNKISTTEIE